LRTSIFVMGPSRNFGFRDEAWLSGRTCRALSSTWSAHLVSDLIRVGKGWDRCLSPYSMHGAGSIGVGDGGSDSWDWPSALLWDVGALSGFAPSSSLELRAWHQYPPCLASFSL